MDAAFSISYLRSVFDFESEETDSPPEQEFNTDYLGNYIQKKVTGKALSVLIKFAEESQRRIKGYNDNPSLLSEGAFFPNEYYLALKALNRTSEIESLRNEDSFYHGLASKEYFSMIEDRSSPSGKLPYHFVIKRGVLPQKALKSIRKDLSFISTGDACFISYYAALLKMIGKEKFNAVFAWNSKTPFMINYSVKNPIYCLFDTQAIGLRRTGDIVHIANTLFYPVKHLNGDYASLTSLCQGNESEEKDLQKFVTFGLEPGATIEDINEKLRSEFNQPPIEKEVFREEVTKGIICTYSAEELEFSQLCHDITFSIERFKKNAGGTISNVLRINEVRWFQLEAASISQAKELLESWSN